ncbi:hypothetical protein BpHYR1_020145 [Brachionus plicatilis]|uniref:Uncharacterized protein n=1 Tax=Brachionus plicatilis TaxID=10195 RepID=A0A3M7PDD8_BRAPC|nr:hypothetical protein BpHYR1_020145 [Brachionus plicatilis]
MQHINNLKHSKFGLFRLIQLHLIQSTDQKEKNSNWYFDLFKEKIIWVLAFIEALVQRSNTTTEEQPAFYALRISNT